MSSPPDSLAERGRRTRGALTCLMLLIGLALLTWGSVVYSRSRMSLDDAIELADAGKFTDAEVRLEAHLKRHPNHNAARLLLAQILIKKNAPSKGSEAPTTSRIESATRALEHLGKIRPENSGMASLIQLARGNAFDQLSQLDEAEAAWRQAIDIDPLTPEAGWNLLNLYYLQWREAEARELALRLFDVEPDPHDRVMLLLELLRHDARPPAAGSISRLFEPIVRAHPEDLHAPLTLGLALTRANQIEEGIDQVRKVVEAHPDRVESWDSLLTCLDESGQVDIMEDELDRLPTEMANAPRLLKHRARVAQGRRWQAAVDLYRQAQKAEPYNRTIEYRLSRALRHVSQNEEADRIESRLISRDHAIQELRPLYDQATDSNDLRVNSRVELFQKIADARERMQFPQEARAWHRLVLQAQPENTVSKASLARLGSGGERG